MNRRIRPEVAAAVFASLLFVFVVGLLDILDPDQPGAWFSQEQEAPERVSADSQADIPQEPDCARSETLFAEKLTESRSCRFDTDCALVRLECPFECVSAVSATLVPELKREEGDFLQACRRCESSCPETLVKWRAACVRHRCIVLDRSVEELQEETLRRINESG